MIIRYGEAEALQPDPNGAFLEYLRESWTAVLAQYFDAIDHAADHRGDLPDIVRWPRLPVPKINSIILPNGLTRPARGVFLFDNAGKEKVFAAVASVTSLELGVENDVDVRLWKLFPTIAYPVAGEGDDTIWAIVFSDARVYRISSSNSGPAGGNGQIQIWGATDETSRQSQWYGPGPSFDPTPPVPMAYGWPRVWTTRSAHYDDVKAWSVNRIHVSPRSDPYTNERTTKTASDAVTIRMENLDTRGCRGKLTNGVDATPTLAVGVTNYRVSITGLTMRDAVDALPSFVVGDHVATITGESTPRRVEVSVTSNIGTSRVIHGEWVVTGRSPGAALPHAQQWYDDWHSWQAESRAFLFAGMADWWPTGAEDYVSWECWPRPVTRVVPRPASVWCDWSVCGNFSLRPLPDTIVVQGPARLAKYPLTSDFPPSVDEELVRVVDQSQFQSQFQGAPFDMYARVRGLDKIELGPDDWAMAHWSTIHQKFVVGERIPDALRGVRTFSNPATSRTDFERRERDGDWVRWAEFSDSGAGKLEP